MTGRTVLVVDDDDNIREIVRLALELIGGWTVLEADRGAAALRIAREQRPDVVLLDVMMPDMDGPTTFATMQADPATRGIPVILLTAKVKVGQTQLWDGLAVLGVIPKPFSPTTLSHEVDALLEQHRRSGGGSAEVQRSA